MPNPPRGALVVHVDVGPAEAEDLDAGRSPDRVAVSVGEPHHRQVVVAAVDLDDQQRLLPEEVDAETAGLAWQIGRAARAGARRG